MQVVDVEKANSSGSRPAVVNGGNPRWKKRRRRQKLTSIGDSSGEEKDLEAWSKGASVPEGASGEVEWVNVEERGDMTSAAGRHGDVCPSQSRRLT